MEKMAQEPFHLLQHLKSQERFRSLSPSPPLQNSDNATSSFVPFVFQAKEDKRKQSSVKAAKKCANCATCITTEWRRRRKGAEEEEILCNACWCYEKSKGSVRPKSMRKDTIKKRKRSKTDSQSAKKSSKKLPEVPVYQHQPSALLLDAHEDFLSFNVEINRSLEFLIPDIGNELGPLNADQHQYVSNYSIP